ncbi:MAG: hypothetical protein K0S65_1957, partial [Labilithrix sp.]|nr:hypothetical protein [Labilithrix sp.]
APERRYAVKRRMRLLRVSIHDVGPFQNTVLQLAPPEPAEASSTDEGESSTEIAPLFATAPRPVTVLFGGDGTGKTSLLSALALTRPGHVLPPLPMSTSALREPRAAGESPPYVATEWLLGEDDPERPHPLLIASPAAVFPQESPEAAAARRREQALFDRRAQQEGGYVFVSFSGARWFSRVPNMLSVPEKSILRYDVRQPNTSFDDPTRADLTRETIVPFDAMPRAARHLVAFVTLPLRALFAAYPGSELPREREGVVAIDDVESQQDPAILRSLVPLLRRALPNVQWLLTTASTQLALACDAGEVVALRRTSPSRVELGEGLLH